MFVYYPSTDNESALLARASRVGLEAWPARGEDRIGWRAPPPGRANAAGEDTSHSSGSAAPRSSGDDASRSSGGETSQDSANHAQAHRLLVFHGNAGHSLDRRHFATGFQSVDARRSSSNDASSGWEVYLMEYPGYGSRPGSPSEDSFMRAAREAIDRLLAEDPSRPVYLLGESLGSGVATQLAAEYPESVPAVFLVTPFTNLVDAGATLFPRVFVRAVLRERYDNESALTRYRGRVAFLLAGEDEVVTTELGRRLYEGYDGEKRLWIQEDAGHNTLDYSPGAAWWQELSDFLLGR